jgi:hypothetical protein
MSTYDRVRIPGRATRRARSDETWPEAAGVADQARQRLSERLVGATIEESTYDPDTGETTTYFRADSIRTGRALEPDSDSGEVDWVVAPDASDPIRVRQRLRLHEYSTPFPWQRVLWVAACLTTILIGTLSCPK